MPSANAIAHFPISFFVDSVPIPGFSYSSIDLLLEFAFRLAFHFFFFSPIGLAMAEWQELLQTLFIGLIFSYLVAKLISIVVSFKEDNLSISRTTSTAIPQSAEGASKTKPIETDPADVGSGSGDYGLAHEADSVIAEHGSVRNESIGGSDTDDDDWEGVESTELDELFSAATAFVAASAADRVSPKVSNELQLQLYGYYKIATEGPCSTPQPSALKMTARAKWQAWQKLGAMPPEEAMQKYIDIVTELFPSWVAGASGKSKDGNADARSKNSRGPMGPVFSTFVYEETGNELELEDIHGFAREGELENLLKCLESGVSVNIKDSEGRTPLHWAVDRGHSNVVELLVSRNADINVKDVDGQTPLHYAVVCDREAIAEYLVKNNANISEKDNDGKSPCDLCESNWPFIVSAEK